MQPYYEEAGITIYHGDCRDILPHLDFDVFVTDPPYGVEFQGKNTKHTVRSGQGYTRADDAEVGPAIVQSLLTRTDRGLVFPGTRHMFDYPVPADIGCVYCPSGAGRGRWGFACFHPVLYYGKDPHAGNGQTPASMHSFDVSDIQGHPCPKPLPWLRWALKKVSLKGEIIVDPFMGSGTTLEAGKLLGQRAIGIEIEEKYCEIAAKRLSQGVLVFEEK